MPSASYVYAIVPENTHLPAGLTCIGGARVVTISWRALAAVTSPTDLAPRRAIREDVLRHEAVVEALGREGPALPVSFGTILRDREAVVQALAARYDTLAADLVRVGDKLEFGLTVLWDQPGVDGQELDAGHALLGPREGPARESAGRRYLRLRLAEHQRDAARRDRARSLAQSLGEVLNGHAIESRHTILPTARLALRATYLVDPSQVSTFRAACEPIRRAHPDARFLFSGPWPPYSFVTPVQTGAGSTLSRQIQVLGGLAGAQGPTSIGESPWMESAVPNVEAMSCASAATKADER